MADTEACLHCKRSLSRRLLYKRLSLRPQQRCRPGPPQTLSTMRLSLGPGIGGLTTATQMAAKGAKVVVLEK